MICRKFAPNSKKRITLSKVSFLPIIVSMKYIHNLPSFHLTPPASVPPNTTCHRSTLHHLLPFHLTPPAIVPSYTTCHRSILHHLLSFLLTPPASVPHSAICSHHFLKKKHGLELSVANPVARVFLKRKNLAKNL